MKGFKINKTLLEISNIESMCRKEAEKNPTEKDLFQSGKQAAYAHIYFQLKGSLERAKYIESNRLLYKVCFPILGFCLGFLLCMWLFDIADFSKI